MKEREEENKERGIQASRQSPTYRSHSPALLLLQAESLLRSWEHYQKHFRWKSFPLPIYLAACRKGKSETKIAQTLGVPKAEAKIEYQKLKNENRGARESEKENGKVQTLATPPRTLATHTSLYLLENPASSFLHYCSPFAESLSFPLPKTFSVRGSCFSRRNHYKNINRLKTFTVSITVSMQKRKIGKENRKDETKIGNKIGTTFGVPKSETKWKIGVLGKKREREREREKPTFFLKEVSRTFFFRRLRGE